MELTQGKGGGKAGSLLAQREEKKKKKRNDSDMAKRKKVKWASSRSASLRRRGGGKKGNLPVRAGAQALALIKKKRGTCYIIAALYSLPRKEGGKRKGNCCFWMEKRSNGVLGSTHSNPARSSKPLVTSEKERPDVLLQRRAWVE